MNKLTNIFVLSFLFIGFILIASCKWGQKREKPKGKNIICLIDFSDAQNANERLIFYMATIKENIIPELGLYDKVFVLPIDKASVTNSSEILFADLSEKDFEPDMSSPMEEAQITQDNLKKYKDSLTIFFEQNFMKFVEVRKKNSMGTDIFGALEVAQSKLHSHDDNYIFLFSDMMNWSNILKMEPQNKGFNSNNLEAALSKAPNIDLYNSTILVLTGEQVGVSADHFNLVKSFWIKYFETNNSLLFDYNSASTTKLREIMRLKTE